VIATIAMYAVLILIAVGWLILAVDALTTGRPLWWLRRQPPP
jgi:hypothetical protein